MFDLCKHDGVYVHVRGRQKERGVESLGVWFHPCGLGQEAASMLGNEVTGQSVNTHGSLWPWPGGGYRIAVKMETSIKLICQPFGHCVVPLDEPDCSQQERDLETCSKINTKPSGTQTNNQTVYQHHSRKLKSGETRGGWLKFTAH